MRKVREILRLRLGVGLSAHRVAEIGKVSSSTVSEYERRFREAGLLWPVPEEMDDTALERVVRVRPESLSHTKSFDAAGCAPPIRRIAGQQSCEMAYAFSPGEKSLP